MNRKGWSASALKASSTCELAFSLRYTGIRADPTVEDTYTVVGNAVHQAIEDALRSGVSVEERLTQLGTELTSVDLRRLLGHVSTVVKSVAMIQRWLDIYGARDKLELEKSLRAERDGQPWLVGKIDLMFPFTRDGRLHMIVLDHKTGRNEGTIAHDTQLCIYAELVFANYPDVQAVCPIVHYTREGDFAKGDIIDRNERESLQAHIGQLTDHAEMVIQKDKPAPTKSRACDSCGYASRCPLQQGVR